MAANKSDELLASCPEHIDFFETKKAKLALGQVMVVVCGSLFLQFEGDPKIELNAGDGYIAPKSKWRTFHQVFVPPNTICERATWRLF